MRPGLLAIVVASASAGCVFMRLGDQLDGGVGQGASASDPAITGGDEGVPKVDAGSPTPDVSVAVSDIPAPQPDDPATCRGTGVPPDLEPAADRPCTEETAGRTTTFRYAGDRVVFRSDRTTTGSESVYTSEDVGDSRVETVEVNGRTTSRDITLLKDGRAVEADHWTAAANGGLELESHSTWLYDAAGRKQSVVSESTSGTRNVERDFYDAKGRLYLVDGTESRIGSTTALHYSWTFRSWYGNGVLARETVSCGPIELRGTGLHSDCDKIERRWDACGRLTYRLLETRVHSDGRNDLRSSGWSWDAAGRPLSRSDVWTTTVPGIVNSMESYRLDAAGRVFTGSIVVENPPALAAPPENHQASYMYDAAGRTVDRVVDGKSDFHATFDGAGRLTEQTGADGKLIGRWTYSGCGR